MITRILVVVALMSTCASLPINDEDREPTAAQDQTQSSDAVVPQPWPESQPQTEAPQQDGENTPRIWYNFAPSSLTDWLLLVISIAAVGAALKTLNILRVQADAAKDNAAAAKMSAEVSMMALRRQDARIIPWGVWLDPSGRITPNTRIRVALKNHGAFPAEEVRVHITLRLIRADVPTYTALLAEIQAGPVEVALAPTTIVPDRPTIFPFEPLKSLFNTPDIGRLERGELRPVVLIAFGYVNTFGQPVFGVFGSDYSAGEFRITEIQRVSVGIRAALEQLVLPQQAAPGEKNQPNE